MELYVYHVLYHSQVSLFARQVMTTSLKYTWVTGVIFIKNGCLAIEVVVLSKMTPFLLLGHIIKAVKVQNLTLSAVVLLQ